MRKRYHNKARACGLCKPHKRGRDNRWAPRAADALGRAEVEIRSALLRQAAD
jgi:hypothetical protein